MSCKIFIKVFDAKNVLNLNNVPSNPYLKFWFKGRQEATSVKTKTIYNTLNPVWNENLEIISEDYNSDIFQICMYTEDKEKGFPISDIFEFPIRYRSFGEHFVFNEEVKMQNLNAGILHFELDFLIYPETPIEKEVNNENKSDLENDLLALKKENIELKEQFKADLQKLKKQNKELIKKLNDKKSDNSNKFLIDENDEKFFETNEKILDDESSTVYKVTDTRTSKIICKKVVKIDKCKTTLKDYEDSLNEFEFLCSLHHPCICDSIGVNKSDVVQSDNDNDTSTISLFFEFCPYSLKSLLEKKMIDNTMKTKIVIEIAHAMLFIHNNGLIYRDLTVDNVMLNSIFEVKIINLGFSQICEHLSGISPIDYVDSKVFLSPEIIGKKEYDSKTDVYSFGVLVYYIFCEKPPKIEKDEKKIVFNDPSKSISDFCCHLISKCLSSDPNERPTFKEILEDIKKHSYNLASSVDESIISHRDDELIQYDLIE